MRYDTEQKYNFWHKHAGEYWNKLVENHMDDRQFSVYSRLFEMSVRNLEKYDEIEADRLRGAYEQLSKNRVKRLERTEREAQRIPLEKPRIGAADLVYRLFRTGRQGKIHRPKLQDKDILPI